MSLTDRSSSFWERVRSFVPRNRPTESLFDTYPWPDNGTKSPRALDARAQQNLLVAQLAALGFGGR